MLTPMDNLKSTRLCAPPVFKQVKVYADIGVATVTGQLWNAFHNCPVASQPQRDLDGLPLRRSCSSSSPSPSTESAIRAAEPDHLVLRPRKMRSGQRFSYLALDPEETRALERRLPPSASTTTNPISSR